jgi:Tfp pilus assembly PilM family ATPase
VGAATAAALPAQWVRLFRADIAGPASESQVRAHLENELPGLGEALAIDYCALPTEQSVMAVAVTKRDYLERYSACLTEAGFDLKIIDIDSCAIQRVMGCYPGALLWQRRNTFTLIWQDEKQLLQQTQWPASYGERNITDLTQHLAQYGVTQLRFCGSSYFAELFSKAQTLPCVMQPFTSEFIKRDSAILTSSVNLPDYLLAIGLAMREVPAW